MMTEQNFSSGQLMNFSGEFPKDDGGQDGEYKDKHQNYKSEDRWET